jgi:DNA invertase Pin-like site-specific DNA recombinase
MPLRVATLTRRSTDEQHQPFSIEAQDTKLAAYIQSQDDWQLALGCQYTDQAGVAFCSASEHFDTHTPAGRMIVQILGAFAEFERATIIDRVIADMERKAASGAWCGGTRPYGYQVDTTTGYLTPHPPLIDPATFQAAQRLLQERGEDRRVSASNASDHLLASQLRQVIEHAPVTAKKALAQQPIHEVRVQPVW